jgi:hypothetical protein
MTKLRQLVVSLAVLALTPACGLLGGGGLGLPGGIGGPKVPPVYGPYEVKGGDLIKIGLGEREVKIQNSIEVPPDRGTVNVRINAHGSSFDSAAAQMQKAFADLKKIGQTAGCGFKINHYIVPGSSDNLKWFTGGNVDVWAEVTGKDPDARITQANTCFKPLREYVLGLPKYDKGTESGYEMKEAILGPSEVWSVEKLEPHRDALVKLANDRMKAVESASSKLWDHADVQCTSVGEIVVANSSSHGVTLTLEMLCPVSPAETNVGHQVNK